MKRILVFWILVVLIMSFVSGCNSGGDTPSAALETWHWRTPLPQGDNLSAITYGNGLFVAVGDNGAIITSPDGVSWIARSSGTNNRLNGIAYGNGLYVAVGENARILTSPDGMTWADRSDLQPFIPSLTEITFGNGMFVASGVFDRYIYSFTSLDGATWTNGASGIHAITYANGIFLAVQTYIPVHGYPWSQTVVTSPDGVTWTPISTLNWPFYISQTAYGKGLFVGVGGTSISPIIVTSPDGVSWTERASGTAEPLFSVTYGSGFFVVVGNNGTILVSSDGTNWVDRKQAFSGSFSGITYGNGTFVAVGSNGVILQSDPL